MNDSLWSRLNSIDLPMWLIVDTLFLLFSALLPCSRKVKKSAWIITYYMLCLLFLYLCLDGINTVTVSTVCIMLWKCLTVHFYNCTSEEDNTNESGQRCTEMLSLSLRPGSVNRAVIKRNMETKMWKSVRKFHQPWSHSLPTVSGQSIQTMADLCSVEWRIQLSARPWKPKF